MRSKPGEVVGQNHFKQLKMFNLCYYCDDNDEYGLVGCKGM
jgi:hypothetical protein